MIAQNDPWNRSYAIVSIDSLFIFRLSTMIDQTFTILQKLSTLQVEVHGLCIVEFKKNVRFFVFIYDLESSTIQFKRRFLSFWFFRQRIGHTFPIVDEKSNVLWIKQIEQSLCSFFNIAFDECEWAWSFDSFYTLHAQRSNFYLLSIVAATIQNALCWCSSKRISVRERQNKKKKNTHTERASIENEN